MSNYDPSNWFWKVKDIGVWSSSAGAYVEDYDENSLTLIDTEENLQSVLNRCGLRGPIDAINKSVDISQLWQAAHDYEYAQISGTAVGLLTAGVLQALPKSLAVQSWCGSIWNIYYTNKAIIEGGGDFSESMLDYSSVGDIPHTVPELREEIGM
jgi:hypothetical protein